MSLTLRTLAAGAALLALAGCEAQPIGTFDDATVTSEAAQAHQDLYFRPGAASFLPGEAEKMNAFLRALLLRPQDDVIVTFGTTGSDVLNARRAAELRRVIASRPARLRIVGPLGFARAPDRPDVVMVQVKRYDSVLVTCQGNGRTNENFAQLTPIPLLGCANQANLANQADQLRDLTAPRELRGSDAIQSVRAVETYRTEEITVTSPEIDPSN